jgi:hypothetical protein
MKTTRAMSEENLLARFNCGPVKLTEPCPLSTNGHLTLRPVIPVRHGHSRGTDSKPSRTRFATFSRNDGSTPSRPIRKQQRQTRLLSVARNFSSAARLANNITNLMLNPVWASFARLHSIDPWKSSKQDRMPVWATAAWAAGRLLSGFDGDAGIPGIGLGPAV